MEERNHAAAIESIEPVHKQQDDDDWNNEVPFKSKVQTESSVDACTNTDKEVSQDSDETLARSASEKAYQESYVQVNVILSCIVSFHMHACVL